MLASLVGMLTFTAALVHALYPGPLAPDASISLFAIGGGQSMSQIFDTPEPVRANQWRYIYVHQSLTPAGNAMTLGQGNSGPADHFIIGNGDGCVDGELQFTHRWSRQSPAGTVPGTTGIDPNCISICLVGDFNHDRPTPTQQARLVQLVKALQDKLAIPANNVILLGRNNKTPAGPGTNFPLADFQSQLLP